MNFKYLSKYHYIYRLSFGGDYKAHVEKLPIAYANKHYIYVIVPGDDELYKVCISNSVYYKINDAAGNIGSYLEHNNFYSQKFWFLLDDPESLKEFASSISATGLRRHFLEREKKKAEREKKKAERDLNFYKSQVKKYESEIACLNFKLSQLSDADGN